MSFGRFDCVIECIWAQCSQKRRVVFFTVAAAATAYRDIVIFKLLGCWLPPSWISLDVKFVTDQTVTKAELRHRAKFC